MKVVDHAFLRQEKVNPASKTTDCVKCQNTIDQLTNTLDNTDELIRSGFTKFELLLWIESNEIYIKRKKTYFYNTYNLRDIVLIDLGQNVGNELSYEHFAIVLKNSYDKMFVVPCSSSKIKKAYNPKTGTLYDEYLVGDVADGFSKKTVIMTRDAKWISKSRVLKRTGTISKPLFDQLYDKIFIDLFEPRHHLLGVIKQNNVDLRNDLIDTIRERDNLLDTVDELKRQIANLESESSRLKDDIIIPNNGNKNVDMANNT